MTKNHKNYFEKPKKIHFIGIGGSGMFPLVEILKENGHKITGSDNNKTENTRLLEEMGIKVFYEHKAQNLKNAEIIIYTNAVSNENEELKTAKTLNIPVLERAYVLSNLTKTKSKCICISGTHGKTTTSSMVTNVLLESNLDPSFIIGGKIKNLNSSGKFSKNDLTVVEACEFKNHFLSLSPYVSVILNIEEDHLDFFKNLDNIIKSFKTFCNITKKAVIYNGDDINLKKVINEIKDKELISFGLSENNDFYAKDIKFLNNEYFSQYKLYHKGKFLTELNLKVPGVHNILNSLACIAVCFPFVNEKSSIYKALSEFTGTKRRFELITSINGAKIVDDYAHHPSEIKTTLETAKQMGFKRVFAIHQPFTYSRTKTFLDDFASSLSIADYTILTEIMGAREENIYNVSSEHLCKKIKNCKIIKDFNDIAEYIISNAKKGDIFICMSCGDITKICEILVDLKKTRNLTD